MRGSLCARARAFSIPDFPSVYNRKLIFPGVSPVNCAGLERAEFSRDFRSGNSPPELSRWIIDPRPRLFAARDARASETPFARKGPGTSFPRHPPTRLEPGRPRTRVHGRLFILELGL